jgi:Protein of unknown function (DUF3052)
MGGRAQVSVDSSVGGGRGHVVGRLGFSGDAAVQVIGWDDDCDTELLDAVQEHVGEVLMDQAPDVVDGVLVWWRREDGDLADGLLDALAMLADHGLIWLLTPRPGRAGHMPGSEVKEAVQVAGLRVTGSISVGADWQASRLTAPKSGR